MLFVVLVLSHPSAHSLDIRSIEGYVYVNGVQKLQESWSVQISLADVSKMDVASTTVSQTEASVGSKNPFTYYLEYDLAKLNDRFRYALQVRVTDASGNLVAINDQQHLFDSALAPIEYDILARVE